MNIDDNTPTSRIGQELTRGGHRLRHDWPANCRLHAWGGGLVIAADGSAYGTAFFEAFPRDPDTLLRGQGATIDDAEDDAWAKWQQRCRCPGHEFEPRGYRNGAGICRHCDLFAADVFTAQDLGMVCSVCAIPANYEFVGDDSWCREHAPDLVELIALGRALREREGRPAGVADMLDDLLESSLTAAQEDTSGGVGS